jgi:hypothetical protein
MRVLKIFFTSLLILLVLGAAAGLIARELLLYTGISQLRSAAKELRSLQVGQDFTQNCLNYGGLPDEGQAVVQSQLRFISDKDYVLEVVCRGTQTTEIGESLGKIIRKDSLPPLVTKDSGQSGIIDGWDFHGVTLSILGRTGAVYRDDSFVRSDFSYPEDSRLQFENGPVTSCEGYGFECCDDAYQVGQDRQNTQAIDCPRSCYASCAERPVVLVFNSDPSPNYQNQIVNVQAGDLIEFYYTVNDVAGDAEVRAAFVKEEAPELTWDEKLLRIFDQLFNRRSAKDSLDHIVITFGDGESAQVSDLQGMVTHAYTCDNRQLCVYNATIQAVTVSGLTSNLGETSKIEIHVTP